MFSRASIARSSSASSPAATPLFDVFARDIDRDQHTLYAVDGGGPLVNFPGETLAVNIVDEGSLAEELLDLVALQATDEVPVDIVGVGQGLGPNLQLLDVVFAEVAQAGSVGRAQQLKRLLFAHADEGHLVNGASGARASGRDARPHGLQAQLDAATATTHDGVPREYAGRGPPTSPRHSTTSDNGRPTTLVIEPLMRATQAAAMP